MERNVGATLIKKGNQIVLIYKEIRRSEAVAKSYCMRKGFLIYE
jgi:hypothetical protein